ncbi:MAG: ATP-binding protein [bacterium]|nr:ATP-binding protein [bacterium]
MLPSLANFFLLVTFSLSTLLLILIVYLWHKDRQLQLLSKSYAQRENELRRKIYEAQVLEEINKRIGYSLDFEKVIEILSGSLRQLIKYSTISYVFLKQEKVLFRVRLEEVVGPQYMEDLRRKSLDSLTALTEAPTRNLPLEELTTGNITDPARPTTIASFFNIPLIVDDRVHGVLTVASTSPSLYQEEDMTLLYKIVNQASTALSKLSELISTEKDKIGAVIESLSDGVIVVSEDFDILMSNPSARKYLDFSRDVAFGKLADSLGYSLDIKNKIIECFSKGVNLGPFSHETKNRYLEIYLAPVTRDKQTTGVVVLIQDQSKEKELEKLREEFTMMVIHDLRTPLSIIFGSSDLLIKRYQELTAERQKEILASLKDSSKKMLDHITNLLDVAKIEAEKWQVTKTESDLALLLREKYEYFSFLAKEKQLKFQLHIPAKIPRLNFDAEQIGRVLDNLLSNAFKFTTSGQVILGANLDIHAVKIYVQDTGPGIPPEQIRYLFSKFGQLKHAINFSEAGSGLGLVIAKGIVETHGGEITVDSTVGSGSTFMFTLPL